MWNDAFQSLGGYKARFEWCEASVWNDAFQNLGIIRRDLNGVSLRGYKAVSLRVSTK